MKLQLFSIFDTKTSAYSIPFFCRTKGEAIRSFSDEVNNPQTQTAKHSADFILFHIGEYDDQNGEVISIPPVSLGNAVEFKKIDA